MSARPAVPRLILAYYLGGTPLFILGDLALGLSVRASFFDDVAARGAYYAFCLLCGVLARWRPRLAPGIGVGESALNITLLVVAFMTPILTAGSAIAADPFASLEAPVTPEGILNFALAGGMAWWSFQRRSSAMRG